MTALFQTRALSVRYGRVEAVRGVSLSLDRGGIIALIGANGAGKTSTLRGITGLTPPAAGEILLDGERIDRLRPDAIVARGVAMVPEGRRVFPYMSVRDNMLMGAHRRRDRAAIRSDIDGVYARFPRLGERRAQAAGSLSGGEQQMVAIGRALMARPRLLLLDEPCLGLAPMVVREIGRTIRAINRDSGVAMVLVEQNSRMALALADQAYVLESGQVALSGPAAALRANDHVRRLYLGG